jgi:hypothetical protein
VPAEVEIRNGNPKFEANIEGNLGKHHKVMNVASEMYLLQHMV